MSLIGGTEVPLSKGIRCANRHSVMVLCSLSLNLFQLSETTLDCPDSGKTRRRCVYPERVSSIYWTNVKYVG